MPVHTPSEHLNDGRQRKRRDGTGAVKTDQSHPPSLRRARRKVTTFDGAAFRNESRKNAFQNMRVTSFGTFPTKCSNSEGLCPGLLSCNEEVRDSKNRLSKFTWRYQVYENSVELDSFSQGVD